MLTSEKSSGPRGRGQWFVPIDRRRMNGQDRLKLAPLSRPRNEPGPVDSLSGDMRPCAHAPMHTPNRSPFVRHSRPNMENPVSRCSSFATTYMSDSLAQSIAPNAKASGRDKHAYCTMRESKKMHRKRKF